MVITKVKMNEDGGFQVNDTMSVPDDVMNRDRRKLQVWIDAGNTPTAYVAPVKTWEENRQEEYAKLNQFEMQFDDQRDSTTTWVDAVNAIKSQFPKPE